MITLPNQPTVKPVHLILFKTLPRKTDSQLLKIETFAPKSYKSFYQSFQLKAQII